MNTAIVTGATGFIGGALTRELARNGTHVFALGRNPQKLAELQKTQNVTAVHTDLRTAIRWNEKNLRGGVFYHCAFDGGFASDALKDYSLQLNNARMGCDAVQLALEVGAKRFVLTSTVNTVELRGFWEKEGFVPRGTCIYSAGKLAAEFIGKTLAHSAGMEYCTALVAMPYGEGNDASTLPNVVMRQLKAGIRPKLIEGNGLYDLVYIDDVAGALRAIGERGRDFCDYYVGHRRLRTFKEWMTRLRDALAPEAELGFGEYPDAPSLDYNIVDLDALWRDTGFECQANFEESIVKTARWLCTQGGGTR